MSYLLAIPSTTPVYPVTHAALQAAYPSSLFPDSFAGLDEFHVHSVTTSAPPDHDPTTHKVVEIMPTGSGSTWAQAWSVVPLTDDELAAQMLFTPEEPAISIEDRLEALEERLAVLEAL